MVTTVVMMTQHVAAADVSTAAATTAPSEHLSVTNASGHMTAASPCGSSVVVYSPTKLREEEKRIQMVSELIGIRYHGGLCILYIHPYLGLRGFVVPKGSFAFTEVRVN